LDKKEKKIFNAVLDASIAVWEAKRFYDYCQPITAIRHLFRGKTIKSWGGPGKGTVELQGENWHTFQVNTFPMPPFAEYVSGHSSFSMAAATVLKLLPAAIILDIFICKQSLWQQTPPKKWLAFPFVGKLLQKLHLMPTNRGFMVASIFLKVMWPGLNWGEKRVEANDPSGVESL
jgi:hypothetical protein